MNNRRVEILRNWLTRRSVRVLRHRVLARRRVREYCMLGDGCSIGVLDRFCAELQRLREGE